MATYVTWNPSDKWPNLTLSSGNLTVSKSTANGELVRSTISKWPSSWKWYWEVTMTTWNHLTGIANSSATTGWFVWFDANWWWYYENWDKYNWWTLTAYGSAYTNWDIIWVALDYSWSTASVTFYKNNVSQWVAFSGLSGNLFASDSLANTASSTTNFGATAFTYTPPAGFVGLSTWTNASNFFMFF